MFLFLALLLFTGMSLLLMNYFSYRFIRIACYVFFLSGLIVFIYMWLLKVAGRLGK